MDVLTDVLAALETGPTLCARTRAHAPWGLRFGGNQGFGFHVILQGTCWLTTGDEPPRALQAGDVVLLAAGAEHTLADAPASPAVTFRLDRERHSTRLGHEHVAGVAGGAPTVLLSGAYRLEKHRPHPLLATLPDVVHLPNRRRNGLHAAVDLLGAEVEEQEPGAEAIVSSLVDALLVYILRAWQEDHPSGWSRALADPAIGPSLHRMHRDPARPWTVEQLGAAAGLSRATFTRRFTALVGEPPLTYLIRWRLTTAARILRQQDVPLSVVAHRVGYTSEFAFAKAFKREYGLAPGTYRRVTER
ncbi:AraC family transcriptional regulator [Frankia sp. AgB1.9]|uniref:AraC family transcriptional regulator n=1 Tax=unclassified Frankia TaxID=2632575 RepID=UPI001931544E|nr:MULTISPECIES: AraC family transcriptional regulator [unclassified Frankia]MBL7493156.1 AraC family transcriptional regulator [Frankia sp. AgW1.1]MBL7548406.1 AraC family transcriptional regulator [Frankia sp. AgB1.9]MBL7619115.1 AraC family transcriptional regulator [Frankia sp. AgB1.8]